MQRRTREDPEERVAWSACRWRAERTLREWRVAVVDDAIEARVRTGAYALLDEDRASGWNDEAHRLHADVTDDLVRRTGAATRPLVDHHVQLAVLDWFLLPSSSAALAYLEVRAAVRRDFGLERWRWPQGPAEEVFDVPPAALSGAPAGVPRVEVHQHERRVLVARIATRTDGSFSRRWGALSRTGELVAIDADLLTGPAPPAGFPAALTALLRGWDALQGEYGSHVCSTQMHFAHAGREPFPPFEEPGRRRPGRGRPATRP